MSVIDFPSEADVERIYASLPFTGLNELMFSKMKQRGRPGTGLCALKRAMDEDEFLWQFHYRLMDLAKSYVMLIFFAEKGIPDDEWYISPGRDGASVEYFPHFEAGHYLVKDWFDYYSEVFYYTCSSLPSTWLVIY